MYKAQREVFDREEIARIIESCEVCRIAICTGGAPYIVPLSYGFDFSLQGELVLYFHSAPHGQKLELLAQNDKVGFEIGRMLSLKAAENACGYSLYFESVLGSGELLCCETNDQKIEGLDALMQHYAPDRIPEYSEDLLARTTVLKLTATEFTAKRHIGPAS